MTRRELIQAFLPVTLYKQKPAPEVVPAKAMDKHCPVCGIKGDEPFYHIPRVTYDGMADMTIDSNGFLKLNVVELFLCRQDGTVFGYDKNDAGGK